jgi:hypothetical protein
VLYNENNTKLSNQEVKELLETSPNFFASYSAGQTKASVEDFFLVPVLLLLI